MPVRTGALRGRSSTWRSPVRPVAQDSIQGYSARKPKNRPGMITPGIRMFIDRV